MDKQEPIRVLHVVGRMDRGGIETMIMNLFRNIDRSKVQFDFLAHYGREAVYNDEIRALGGRIYEMPTLRDEMHVYYCRFFEYIAALNKFFKEHQEYKIVHGHMTNTASIYMPIARKYGVTCCISHSHSSHGKAGLLGLVTNLLQKPIYKNATDWFTCSKVAAKWFYPQAAIDAGKVTVLPNAVDAERFRLNPTKQDEMRKQFGVENKVVIGCVGRFRKEKNQIFLAKLLDQIVAKEPNAMLLFAGDGPCEDEVKAEVAAKGLSNQAIFLGMRSDIPDVMQAMDVLVMPSIFEGLPVTGIEAQASGLRIVASSGVTDEMNAIDMVEYIALDEPAEQWVEAILNAARSPKEDTYHQIIAKNYDIHTAAPWLQAFYLSKVREG